MANIVSAAAAGSIKIGGELKVNRLGYGAMRLTGPGVWGEPKDKDEAIRVLHRAVELGVNFIDTADSYGPFISEQLIKKALYPYKDGLIIATKVGQVRPGPNKWVPVGRPEYLRQQVELSLRHLGLERIDLLQLHRIDPKVPLAEQIGELSLLQQEGKIHFIGLSEVSVEQLKAASEIATIVSVQNQYNLTKRDADPLIDYAELHHITFIPWFPLATGKLAAVGGPLDKLAGQLGVKPSQLALAWLLKRSPAMLPIPGTSSVAHVEENISAAGIELCNEDFSKLSSAI